MRQADQVGDTLGVGGVFVDPVWRERVLLTALEQDLLRCWWVRRLAFVAHAGAAASVSTQSYSRLEHSLGLLALVARYAPGDHAVRAAALLHDVGHLPLSHTFEGVAGLDHHRLGAARIAQLAPVLAAHGVEVDAVLDIVEGRQPSALHGPSPALRLDHLESWVRSAYARGRTQETPADTLARLRLRDGAVDTDPGTAAYLVELGADEARWRLSAPNLVATGLVRQLVGVLLDGLDPAGVRRVAELTDPELWTMLLTHPRTGPTADAFRRDPAAWTAVADDPRRGVDDQGNGGVVVELTRLYLDRPLADGEPLVDDVAARLVDPVALPLRYRIRPSRAPG